MNLTARKYAAQDDPKAIIYLKQAHEALTVRDFQTAMRNFKKCYKLRITKPLTCLLLHQMANCMDHLEYYDQQQIFLEELCEQELNITNVQQLMKIYNATNNEAKKTTFISKIKELTAKDEDERKIAITLLLQAKDHDEVIERCREWILKNPEDEEISKMLINAYIEKKLIEDAWEFAKELINRGFEDKFYLELSSLHIEMFDFESSRDYFLKHMEMIKENTFSVAKLAYSLMTNANYHGTLSDEAYLQWMERAHMGTWPQTALNMDFPINTDFFRRIRVGFISYDFREHSVGKFIASLFEVIKNNTGIETYCYYTYPDYEDRFTRHIKDRADVFKSLGNYSPSQLRRELLSDNLDILIDLNGQTAGNKLEMLAERFAPIQVTWMGFPFSSFFYNIDYIIGDYLLDPPEGETGKFCTENILRMDVSYMCFTQKYDLYIHPEPPQTGNGFITFGMMNNPNKYSEESIRLWQKCLEATPDSRLLIQLGNFKGFFVEEKLRERFTKFGLDLSRVDFGVDYGQNGYWGTYNKVDVMLDTLPFGGGTTTPEAIWMGVPVVGCSYHMRHGRMAYAFMHNVGLGHLCADSVETYPEKVREIAQNVNLLRDLRQNLRDRLLNTPLFNTELFRDDFENAIRNVYIQYCRENKKAFNPSVYDEDDGRLLRDCVRAADIVSYEITREHDRNEERLDELLSEYHSLHTKMMERILLIYQNDINALSLVEKAAQLLEMMSGVTDGQTMHDMIKTIRIVLVKFA